MNQLQSQVDALVETAGRVRAAMETVIQGKRPVIDMTLTVLLAEGHLLLEDVPGVGKTMLAKALARSLSLSSRRIQFTPDLLPSDITGVSIYRQAEGTFEFSPGAIFAHIVLADEINRASPKTQAAMLEAMEEMHVSVDGASHPLPRPFMVVATQNPIEMEGTYPLPEAQRDRFMARIAMGYPMPEAEIAMLDAHAGRDPLADVTPVADAATLSQLIETTRAVMVAQPLKQYLVDIATATRQDASLRLGASPRAIISLLRAAQSRAALHGREYVAPDDIRELAPAVLAHRVVPSAEAGLTASSVESLLETIVRGVRVPGER